MPAFGIPNASASDPDTYLRSALKMKAGMPVVLDMTGLTSVADCFILLSASSTRQVGAIAEHLRRDLKKQGIAPISVEGTEENTWVLMDYGDIVLHIFYESVRGVYDLESLWSEARRIRPPSLLEWEERMAAEPVDGGEDEKSPLARYRDANDDWEEV